jgi:hypothetical protein
MGETRDGPGDDGILGKEDAAHTQPEPMRRRTSKDAALAAETGMKVAHEIQGELPAPCLEDPPEVPPPEPGSLPSAEPVREGHEVSAGHRRRILPAHATSISGDSEHGFRMGEDHVHGKAVIESCPDPGPDTNDVIDDLASNSRPGTLGASRRWTRPNDI